VTPPPIGSTHTSTNQYCGLLRTNRCEESDGRLLRPSASRRAACHWTRGEFLELVFGRAISFHTIMVFHPLARFNRVAFEIISDNTRKFLGVKLTPRGQTITGTFAWVPSGPSAGQPPMLRLTCSPAQLRVDAGSARPSAALEGVAALTTGRAVMAAGDAEIDPPGVFDAVTNEQVGVLVGGGGPELHDWAANGSIVRFRSLLGEPTLRLGHRVTLASGQEVVLVSAEGGVPFSEPYLPAATVDAAIAAAPATEAAPAPAATAPAPASSAPAFALCAYGAARSAAGTAATEASETTTVPAWAST
jgi:hypothetical protein